MLLRKDKADLLDKMGFEILPGLKDMTTEERIEYAEEFLGIDFLPEHMPHEHIQIRRTTKGLQEDTIDHKCGHCGREVAGIVVAKNIAMSAQWLACPSCKCGSVLNNSRVVPAPLLGDDIEGLPDTIKNAYLEARKSISSESYTACELMCRKILMHIAVEKKASEGETFAQYIDYMSKEGYVTVTMKPWVKQIKDNGNEATHTINAPDYERAKTTLEFTILLLKNVYETEYRMKPDPVGSK